MELPLAPRSPEKLFTPPDQPNFEQANLGVSLGAIRRPEQRDTGMPPSVAGQTLLNEPPQAMKKRPSHRPLERFPADCCAKNTQFGHTPGRAVARFGPGGPERAGRGIRTPALERRRPFLGIRFGAGAIRPPATPHMP